MHERKEHDEWEEHEPPETGVLFVCDATPPHTCSNCISLPIHACIPYISVPWRKEAGETVASVHGCQSDTSERVPQLQGRKWRRGGRGERATELTS